MTPTTSHIAPSVPSAIESASICDQDATATCTDGVATGLSDVTFIAASLASAIDRDGFDAVPYADLRAVVIAARQRGLSDAVATIVLDATAPDVLRRRAFGRAATRATSTRTFTTNLRLLAG